MTKTSTLSHQLILPLRSGNLTYYSYSITQFKGQWAPQKPHRAGSPPSQRFRAAPKVTWLTDGREGFRRQVSRLPVRYFYILLLIFLDCNSFKVGGPKLCCFIVQKVTFRWNITNNQCLITGRGTSGLWYHQGYLGAHYGYVPDTR